MQKQILFNDNNMDLLFLSPYVDVYGKGTNKVLLYRRDTKQKLLMQCDDAKALNEILGYLQDGIREEILLSQINSINISEGKQWIEYCVKKGVLE